MVSPKCARTASANPGPCFQTWSTTFLGTGKNGAWWNYTLPVFAFWSAWGNKQSKRSTVRISIGLVATWLLLLHSIYKKDTFIHKSVLREKIHICHLLQWHSILNFWIRLQEKLEIVWSKLRKMMSVFKSCWYLSLTKLCLPTFFMFSWSTTLQ